VNTPVEQLVIPGLPVSNKTAERRQKQMARYDAARPGAHAAHRARVGEATRIKEQIRARRHQKHLEDRGRQAANAAGAPQRVTTTLPEKQ